MIALTERQRILISYLLAQTDYKTIKDLSKEFEVSERTIRYDLEHISNILKELNITFEKKPKFGTKIILSCKNDQQILRNIIKQSNLYSQDERSIIIAILILTKPHTVDNICDILYVSRNTVLQDIKKTKAILLELGIDIKNALQIDSSEREIRDAFMKLFAMHSKSIDFNVYIEKLISEETIEIIINNIEKELNIEYTSVSIEEIKIVLQYVANRCKNNFKIDLEITSDDFDEDFNILKKQVINHSKVEFKINDIFYILKWFKSAKTLSVINEYSKSSVSNFNEVAFEIIRDMESITGLSFIDDKDFVTSFSMHLNVAIYRLRNNFIIENPLEEEIKIHIPYRSPHIIYGLYDCSYFNCWWFIWCEFNLHRCVSSWSYDGYFSSSMSTIYEKNYKH